MSPLLLLLLLLLLGLLSLILWVLCDRKRRDGEPPLIKGWIPYVGKALEFGRDAHTFLEKHRKKFGDVFTVRIAGKHMTFIMDPLLYPSIVRHGRQLDFHEFTSKVAPFAFAYPPLFSGKFPGLWDQVVRSFQLLQGDNLTALTESMMGNLMLVLRQDHLGEEGVWKSANMYDFCNAIIFEASLLTVYGRTAAGRRHSDVAILRKDFTSFDSMFPLLVARIPVWLLGRTKAVRQKLISYFLPHRLASWSNTSQFIRTRAELFEQYDTLRDIDKAAHHFAILWASVANTVPAAFWTMHHLVSHPEALQAVRQELLGVLSLGGAQFSSDRDVALSREQLDQLIYLESAVSESLRLSSASINIRLAQEDFQLKLDTERAVAVRKGDIIALYPQSMHMDPEIYDEPQSFRFDRYVQDGGEKTDFFKDGRRLRYFLMPFGSGSSICPGRRFAINEIKQFLCLLLLYLDLQLDQDQPRPPLHPSRAGLGILQPAFDVRFRYRLRAA